MANKITDLQLKTIQDLRKEMDHSLNTIGLIEAQKHSILHRIADINKASDEFKDELTEQYGAIDVNLDDGTFVEQKIK